MKKRKIMLFLSVFTLLAPHALARDTSSESFKFYMHRIYDNYSNARISITLKRRDITDIHLQHMQEAIHMVQSHIPEVKKDGSPLDRKVFVERINRMQSMVTDLRAAVKYEEPVMTRALPEEIFKMCVTCHTDARMDYLFRLPGRTSLFGEYMHRVSDSLDLARIYMEEGGHAGEAADELKLVDYYIGLLEEAFPDAGPSGVVMDRGEFNSRVKAIRDKGNAAISELKVKKRADLEALRTGLNGLCVACHEPERIK